MNDNFVIAAEHAMIVSELTDEQAGQVFKALFIDDPEMDDIAVRIVYKTIKAQVDRYKEKYNKRSEAGKKGMQSRFGVTKDNNCITNHNNVITNDNKPQQTITPVPDPVPVKEITPKGVTKKKFTPPTKEQVQEYVNEQNYNVDVEKFIDFYTSKGWMVGKNPMKDWKAAVRNWSRSQRQEVTAKPTVNKFNNFPQRTYDDLERKMWERQGQMLKAMGEI